jgi:hypothetical protein
VDRLTVEESGSDLLGLSGRRCSVRDRQSEEGRLVRSEGNLSSGAKWFASATILLLIINAALLGGVLLQLRRANAGLGMMTNNLSSVSSDTSRMATDVGRVRAEIVAIRSATPCAVDPDTPIGEAIEQRRQSGCH